MHVLDLVDQITAAGGMLYRDGDAIRVTGPRNLIKGWAPYLRLHRDRLIAMSDGDALDRALLQPHPLSAHDQEAAAALATGIGPDPDDLAAYRDVLVTILAAHTDTLPTYLAIEVEAWRHVTRRSREHRREFVRTAENVA